MGGKTPETCRATHKRQVINLWNCCILLVDLFESYDDARTCERQIDSRSYLQTADLYFGMVRMGWIWLSTSVLIATGLWAGLDGVQCEMSIWFNKRVKYHPQIIKICPASSHETCQWLKFPPNGLRAQSRVSPVVGLLPSASGPACLGMAFPPFLVKQLYRCDSVVISSFVRTGYSKRRWGWLLGGIGYSITHHYPLYALYYISTRKPDIWLG